MSHLTVMGASLSRFELLIQQYAPVDYSMDPGSVVPTTVQLVPQGSPVACSLSHIGYESLSNSLLVWKETGLRYDVIRDMRFG